MARELILRPGGLDDTRLEQVFGEVLRHRVDYADLYFQIAREESWALEDGIVKDGERRASSRGSACARLPARRPASPTRMKSSCRRSRKPRARRARSLCRARTAPCRRGTRKPGIGSICPSIRRARCATRKKSAWLERVDRETRRLDPRIVQVMASIATVHEVDADRHERGCISAADIRPLVRFNVSVIVEQNGRREQGYAGAGGRFSLAELVAADRPLDLGREAARQALVNLDAVPAPAGSTTVVLGPGWPGVLLHEAIGHGLEGDFNRKGTSAFANRIGERVANPGLHGGRRWHALKAPRLAQHRR